MPHRLQIAREGFDQSGLVSQLGADDAKELKEGFVEQTKAIMQDEDKESDGGHDRHNGGHKEDRAKECDASHLLVQQQSQQQTQKYLRHNSRGHVPDGVVHCQPEAGIDEQDALIVTFLF